MRQNDGYTVNLKFNCPIIDGARLEQVLRHHFGATEIEQSISRGSGNPSDSRRPRWEPKPGTGASELLELVRSKGVVRWREIKGVKGARRALELLLMDGHIVRVRHGVFRDGLKPLEKEVAAKTLEPWVGDRLGVRQQAIYDSLIKPTTAAELRERENVSRQAIDQILKKLIKRGLVRRWPTPGEASEWIYAQAGKRTLDVIVEREPRISPREREAMQLISPVGGVRRTALAEAFGATTPSILKRLLAKGLIEQIGTPKRLIVRLTQRGLSHSAYNLESDHLPAVDTSSNLPAHYLQILLAIDALDAARALDITAVTGIRSKKPPGMGQFLQRLRMSGYIIQERMNGKKAPIYRLSKEGTTAIAAAKLAGKAIDRSDALRAVELDAQRRSAEAATRPFPPSQQGRTPDILRLLDEHGLLSTRQIQDMLTNPFKFYRSVGLAASDLEKRGWIRCERVGEKGLKFWKITPSGVSALPAATAV